MSKSAKELAEKIEWVSSTIALPDEIRDDLDEASDLMRQLAEQRAELLEALKPFAQRYCDTEHIGSASLPSSRACGRCFICKARAAIARAEGGAK